MRISDWSSDVCSSDLPVAANEAYAELAGKTVFTAQKNIVEMLAAAGAMDGDPRPITHPVKFWENGTKPLELVASTQGLIRSPPAAGIIARPNGLALHPEDVVQRPCGEGLVQDVYILEGSRYTQHKKHK